MKKIIIAVLMLTIFAPLTSTSGYALEWKKKFLMFDLCSEGLSRVPYCGEIGSRSEGWYHGVIEGTSTHKLLAYDGCTEKVAICSEIGSKSEGWYVVSQVNVVMGNEAEVIYNSLDVEEEILPSFKIETKLEKTVSTLKCQKVDHMRDGISYECSFDYKDVNAEEIYSALSVREIHIPTPKEIYVLQKTAGQMQCRRVVNMTLSVQFSCTLNN